MLLSREAEGEMPAASATSSSSRATVCAMAVLSGDCLLSCNGLSLVLQNLSGFDTQRSTPLYGKLSRAPGDNRALAGHGLTLVFLSFPHKDGEPATRIPCLTSWQSCITMEAAMWSSKIGRVAASEACTMLWSADTRLAYIFFLLSG